MSEKYLTNNRICAILHPVFRKVTKVTIWCIHCMGRGNFGNPIPYRRSPAGNLRSEDARFSLCRLSENQWRYKYHVQKKQTSCGPGPAADRRCRNPSLGAGPLSGTPPRCISPPRTRRSGSWRSFSLTARTSLSRRRTGQRICSPPSRRSPSTTRGRSSSRSPSGRAWRSSSAIWICS